MSLMEREEFGIEKIIQELQEAVDLGDAPKRGPFGVFVRKEYLVEAIALLRTYPDAQPNEPLTLEELREMQAKPGWLDCKYEKGWGIISVSEFGRMISITTFNDTYFIYANGEYNDLLGAKIYLCPPKEG